MSVPNSPYGLCGRKATLKKKESKRKWTWSPVLNSPYGLCGRKATLKKKESKRKWTWSPVPNSPYGLCGRKAALKWEDRAQMLCERRAGPGLPSLTVPIIRSLWT